MAFPLAMSPTAQCLVVLMLTGVAAPLAGLLLRHVSGGWGSVGKGRFAIEQQLPLPRYAGPPAPPVDSAIQAAEVRQMLAAKSERLQRRGEDPLDVEAETERLLRPAAAPAAPQERQLATLRTEVRQLIVSRNERRMRQGLEPLDIEAETERQLADFIGSR